MNRAERRKVQKKFGDNFADALKEAIQKNSDNVDGEGMETEPEDLNILPLPVQQAVEQTHMMWVWTPMQGVFVFGKLYTAHDDGFNPGDWIVEMAIPGIDSESYAFTDDAPKLIGQALISAWNYKNIWKQHAGEFLERQLMQRPVIASVDDDLISEVAEQDSDVVEILEDPNDQDSVDVEIVDEYPTRPPVSLEDYQATYADSEVSDSTLSNG
jgi:hypothetical protein